jgi:hypothetical protein
LIDRVDEVERFGHIAPYQSKQYSKQIVQTIGLIIPPKEIDESIKKLESLLNFKRAERKNKIKNLKSSKANANSKGEKKSLQQRLS